MIAVIRRACLRRLEMCRSSSMPGQGQGDASARSAARLDAASAVHLTRARREHRRRGGRVRLDDRLDPADCRVGWPERLHGEGSGRAPSPLPPRLPGSIVHIEVTPGREYLVHRNGFLAGTPGIEVTIGFRQPLEASEAAADEFILRRIGGRGRAWVELSGDVVRRDLAAARRCARTRGTSACRKRRSPCRWPSLSGLPPVTWARIAQCFAVLSGPGTVWLQSMPLLAAPHRPFAVRDALTQSSQERGKQEHEP